MKRSPVQRVWTSSNTNTPQAIQKSNKSRTEKKDPTPMALDQSIRVQSTIPLSSIKFFSSPSKFLQFLSRQIHHNKQSGIISHSFLTLVLLQEDPQLANSSIIPHGITHWIPKILKIKFHISLAAKQCKKRWEIDSPFFLHIQHQSSTITRRLRKLYVVRIQPKAATQTKNATQGGALVFQILFQGTQRPILVDNTW